MSRPWFIAVSGIIASGKTTLSRGLARVLEWMYVPENPTALLYLNDFFTDTRRWAFETQIAFLVHKAIQIQEFFQRNKNVILDRSLTEDIEIFAYYFYKRGDIDERGYRTYRAMADHFLESIPSPDLTIYCDCPLQVVERRVLQRNRQFERLYPAGFIEELHHLYETWRSKYDQTALYSIDTSTVDIRRPEVIEEVAKDMITILEQGQRPPYQLQLFTLDTSRIQKDIRFLKPVYIPQKIFERPPRPLTKLRHQVRVTQYPSAYIAAPFTTQAEPVEPEPNLLLDVGVRHGLLKSGRYRKTLIEIDKALRRMGIFPILPHRDINKWGKLKLSPKDVAEQATEYVKQTDVFIGILGLSHGSHYELGLARGLRKPTIIIHCDEIPQSFISSGFAESFDALLTLYCKKMREIPTLLSGERTKAFLSSYIPIRQKD